MADQLHSVDVGAPPKVLSLGPARIQGQGVKMLTWIWGWIVTISRAISIYRRRQALRRAIAGARIDPNAPCPCCGAPNGKLRWEPELEWPPDKEGRKARGACLHTCQVCAASWPEKPIVRAEEWQIKAGDVSNGGVEAPWLNSSQSAQGVRSFGIQR